MPGCRHPHPLTLNRDDSGTLFDIFIALSHLMAGKRGTAARAVGNDLEALIEKAFLPDLFQSPPLRLDEVILVSNVRMLHVGPETNGAGEILPHAFVFPDALFTVFDKGLQTVLLDLLFSVQTQHFLYFQLYRKSVGIPACLYWEPCFPSSPGSAGSYL